MAFRRTDAERLAGTQGVVRDDAGRAVGTIVSVLLEEDSGEPSWVSIARPGSSAAAFIPLTDAEAVGTDIVVAWPGWVIDDAPSLVDAAEMSPAEEQALLAHYNLHRASVLQPADDRPDPRPGAGSEGGVAVTRSEERLRVGVRVRARERIRVVRRVVTENVTFTVPVQREELSVERVPVGERDEPGEADWSGAAGELLFDGQRPFGQGGVEVVLHEQRVEWTTRTVPVERVRVRVHVETTEADVAVDLRAENVEVVED